MYSQVVFCLALFVGCGLLAQAPGPKRLFKAIPENRRRAVEAAAVAADGAPLGIGVKRSRLVELDLPLVNTDAANRFALDMNRPGPPQRLELNLFEDLTLTAVLKKISFAQGGKTLLWSGDVEGVRPGSLTLANTAGVVNGKVALTNGTIYEIRPVAGQAGVRDRSKRAAPRAAAGSGPVASRRCAGPATGS